MAKKPLSESGVKKPARGPQKRTFHFFVRAVDANGAVIEGASLEIGKVITDARKVIEYMDSPESNGYKRVKYEIVSTPREDGSEEETGAVAA